MDICPAPCNCLSTCERDGDSEIPSARSGELLRPALLPLLDSEMFDRLARIDSTLHPIRHGATAIPDMASGVPEQDSPRSAGPGHIWRRETARRQ